jgi:hypothetical protein
VRQIGHFRRTRYGAFAVVVALGATAVATYNAGATSDPGQGTAGAQILRVDPRAGALSIGVGLGESNAGHTNQAAKAQSLSLDLGVIGTSLTTSSCGSAPTISPSQLPQALILENSDPNASKGVTQSQDGGAFTQYGQATKAPYAVATTSIAAQSIKGVLSIGAGVATTWSGIVNGHREAGATVDIASLSLFGLINLGSLHWDVLYQTTPSLVHTGHFSAGNASIAGQALSLPSLVTSLSQLNPVLNSLGIQIQEPIVHENAGIEYVDPLVIAVVPNKTRDSLINTVLNGVAPVTQPLITNLLKAVCKLSTPIEVFDIALGSISGAGSFDVQLGGLSATSGEVASNAFNLGLPGLSVPPIISLLGGNSAPTAPVSTGGSYVAPSTGVSSTPPASPAAAPQISPPVATIQPIKVVHGSRGGALALVALIGLAFLALLAEGDRRMMRRAQRSATFQE